MPPVNLYMTRISGGFPPHNVFAYEKRPLWKRGAKRYGGLLKLTCLT